MDDNVDAAESLSQLLSLMGHEVREAHDGIEGVHAALEFRPDVVLLDLGMPKMTGYEAVRAIRKNATVDGIRIYALTGWGQESDKQRTREAGFDGHITKPIDTAMLESLIA